MATQRKYIRKHPRKPTNEKRKAQRTNDIMSVKEFDELLGEIGIGLYCRKDASHEGLYYGLRPEAWQCLASILWITGKRIGEIIRLRESDFRIDDDDMYITFSILKKNRVAKGETPRTLDETRTLVRPVSTKIITLKNKYVPYVLDYASEFSSGELLFPANTKTGYIYASYFWELLGALNTPVWAHLFRHTLATRLAQDKVSLWELTSWFDWTRTNMAEVYVSRAGIKIDAISNRRE